MVTRLIELDELEKVLRPILTDESCPLHIAAEIDMNIDLMPKVDAVPVVRCRECKHNPKLEWFGCPMAGLSAKQRPETAWCWKGERKDDDNG